MLYVVSTIMDQSMEINVQLSLNISLFDGPFDGEAYFFGAFWKGKGGCFTCSTKSNIGHCGLSIKLYGFTPSNHAHILYLHTDDTK
jgi:hypothetical protein